MTAREKPRWWLAVVSTSLVPVGRILLLVLCICGIALNHSAGAQNAAAQSSGPMKCDAGMSRHSLQAAALREGAVIAKPVVSSDSHSAPAGMVWIPGGRFWMGTEHMQ